MSESHPPLRLVVDNYVTSEFSKPSLPTQGQRVYDSKSSSVPTSKEISHNVDTDNQGAQTQKGSVPVSLPQKETLVSRLLKSDWLQLLGIVAGIVALVFTAFQFAFEAKFDAIESKIDSTEKSLKADIGVLTNKIDEMDRRYELRQNEAEKRQEQWQQLTKELIDEKTKP